MRNYLFLLAVGIMFAPSAGAQNARTPDATEVKLSGRWNVYTNVHGSTLYTTMKLEQDGEKLSGTFEGAKVHGTLKSGAIDLVSKEGKEDTEKITGSLQNGVITGTIVTTSTEENGSRDTTPFTAKRVPERRTGAPQHHEFVPETYYLRFSSDTKPALTIWPGDSVHTKTVDAGGVDEKGVAHVLGGNPETGPFYVETAAPGDMLVVHLTKVRLNRDWADSDDMIVGRAMNSNLAVKMNHSFKDVRWHLDREHGIATPEHPGEDLTHYSIPLRPMLGCMAVAEDPGRSTPDTRDSGSYGGNMDFNEIVEGATVYLPVKVPGALLYMGDGHAVQGDGELTGDALETSMEVEFTVDVIPERAISGPRVESATQLMAMGLAGSLDDAFRSATANMVQWLMDKYKLTPSEIAQVLGTTAQYQISEAADRNAGVVLRIRKDRLETLPPAGK